MILLAIILILAGCDLIIALLFSLDRNYHQASILFSFMLVADIIAIFATYQYIGGLL